MSTEQRETTDATTAPTVDDPVVEVRNAKVTFDEGETYVLDDVSMDIQRDEVLGIVGESGSGKSMFADALLDSIPDPGVLTGEILYHPESGETVDVLEQSDEELRRFRWEEVSMVFQGAMSSFNPTMKVGAHFEETLKAHDKSVADGMEFADELLGIEGVTEALDGRVSAPIEGKSSTVDSPSTGTAVLVTGDYENGRAGFTALGEPGRPAEDVGADAADAFIEHHVTDAAVDHYLADQLLPFLAFAGGRYSIPAVTEHVQSARTVLSAFGHDISIRNDEPPFVVQA